MLLRDHVFHCGMVSAERESDLKEEGEKRRKKNLC